MLIIASKGGGLFTKSDIVKMFGSAALVKYVKRMTILSSSSTVYSPPVSNKREGSPTCSTLLCKYDICAVRICHHVLDQIFENNQLHRFLISGLINDTTGGG